MGVVCPRCFDEIEVFMKKLAKGVSCLAVISLFSLFPVLNSVNAATYKNCSTLNAKFSKGVAKSKSAASKQKFAPKVSASIYNSHRKLDKDNDGTVCEVNKLPKVTPAISVPTSTATPVSSTTVSVVRQTPTTFASELVPMVGTVSGAFYDKFPYRNLGSYQACGSRAVIGANFDYGSGSILPCAQADNVLLKYEGIIPKSNRGKVAVTFQARFDDGVYFSIDGNQLISNWTDGGYRAATGQLNLDLNVDHVFEFWFYENGGLAALDLSWSSISFASELVPMVGTVTGVYYGNVVPSSVPNRNLESYQFCGSRATTAANFTNVSGAISPCAQADNVLLKYEGIIPKSNRGKVAVTFQARFDDGVYFSIDGNQLISNWTDGGYRTATTQANLDLSVDHVFELWFYDISGYATLNLFWSSVASVATTSSIGPRLTTSVPKTTTTTCSPNQQAISSLTQKAGSWRGQNRSGTFKLLQYTGSPVAGTWLSIHDVNYSNYVKALAALNACKQVGYLFDDWDTIKRKAEISRNLKASDSVTFLVVV